MSLGRRICRTHRRASVAWRRYEWQAEAEDHAKFVVTGIASAYLLPAMKINPLSTGASRPGATVLALKPPSGPDRVHEITPDGYRMIVRRPKGDNVRG
jgi:hypothetical protein